MMAFIKYFLPGRRCLLACLRPLIVGMHMQLDRPFPCHSLNYFWKCFVFISVAMIKTQAKSNLGEEGVYFIVSSQVTRSSLRVRAGVRGNTAYYSTHFQPGNLLPSLYSINHGGPLLAGLVSGLFMLT